MFTNSNTLGFLNPYVHSGNGQIVADRELKHVLPFLKGKRIVDVASLIEIISRYHCFAERTVIKGVKRSPWMAKLNKGNDGWDFLDIPKHGSNHLPAKEVAKILFEKLQLEILEYCQSRSTVGVLLSGGMDSRIVSGILDYLLKTGQISANIVAVTWGMEQTRDVVYAHRIAKRLQWDWLHFPMSPEFLMKNIRETAKRGCEYSPVHLHAMPRVREIQGVDCILAASYGDSVGRAEYSGRHLEQLIPFEKHTINWFKLLRVDAYKEASEGIEKDINRYRALFPRPYSYQRNEIDQQAQYMRRKLNHCMAVIDEKIPLLHAFTSPDVFGFMWSLSPRNRNDQIYKHMFDHFKTDLSDIPWARTGRPYMEEGEAFDELPACHHRYGDWIRGDLYDVIREKVLSEPINRLNVFNMEALSSALTLNKKIARHSQATKMDEISIWLAALSDFVAMYDICGFDYKQRPIDHLNAAILGPLEVVALAVSKFILSRK